MTSNTAKEIADQAHVHGRARGCIDNLATMVHKVRLLRFTASAQSAKMWCEAIKRMMLAVQQAWLGPQLPAHEVLPDASHCYPACDTPAQPVSLLAASLAGSMTCQDSAPR